MQDIQDKSAMQEFSHSFTSPSFHSLNGDNYNGHEGEGGSGENDKNAIHRRSVVENKLQEFEIEMERLSSRIEHLRSQNEVLNLSLQESKNQCDNLTVLIGNIIHIYRTILVTELYLLVLSTLLKFVSFLNNFRKIRIKSYGQTIGYQLCRSHH